MEEVISLGTSKYYEETYFNEARKLTTPYHSLFQKNAVTCLKNIGLILILLNI